jgi:hypothetical protein
MPRRPWGRRVSPVFFFGGGATIDALRDGHGHTHIYPLDIPLLADCHVGLSRSLALFWNLITKMKEMAKSVQNTQVRGGLEGRVSRLTW